MDVEFMLTVDLDKSIFFMVDNYLATHDLGLI